MFRKPACRLHKLSKGYRWLADSAIDFLSAARAMGPHTIDQFANQLNSQIAWFNSRWWCPDMEAVDAFTCDWDGDINWVCPPPCLIPRCIWHGANTHKVGSLILPCLPSAPYWSVMYSDGHSTAKFITDLKILQASLYPVLPGRMGSCLPACDVLAVRFDFTTRGRKHRNKVQCNQ